MLEIKYRKYCDACKEFRYTNLDLTWGERFLEPAICVICERASFKGSDQYIGSKDKNGKEIYEGDYLKDCDGWIKKVEDIRDTFMTNSACYDSENGIEKSEIIGNKWENPELSE